MTGFNELCRLYESGKSLPEIERETGVARSTVRSRLIRAGYELRSRADAVRRAAGLGSGRRGKKCPPLSPECRAAISESRKRWADENAKGTRITSHGYVEFTRGEHKGRGVHTVLMERRIGRRLLGDEAVHHIDGDRQNNSINNLALVTTAGHARLHRREESLKRKGN